MKRFFKDGNNNPVQTQHSKWANTHTQSLDSIFPFIKKKKKHEIISPASPFLKLKVWLSHIIIPLLLQMSWAAGTQCVTKGDHRKPKPGELAYLKGDILTIVDTSTVLSCFKGATGSVCSRSLFTYRLTPNFDRSFLEEGVLQGQTQHHRRGGTHKLHQCAWKTCSTCGSQPQPHAVCLPFLWIRHSFYLTVRHCCLTSVGCKHVYILFKSSVTVTLLWLF